MNRWEEKGRKKRQWTHTLKYSAERFKHKKLANFKAPFSENLFSSFLLWKQFHFPLKMWRAASWKDDGDNLSMSHLFALRTRCVQIAVVESIID